MQEHPSPFIGSTRVQHAWDSTSLGWYKECPRKYQYHMIEGWVTRAESVHLRFGILYHKGLEDYDRLRVKGKSHDEALNQVVHETLRVTWNGDHPWRSIVNLPSDDRLSLKNRENLIRSIIWYLDKFPFDRDPAKTVVSRAGMPLVELHFQFELGFEYSHGQPYSLCGYLDRIVSFQDELFVMDRKTTTSTVGSYYFDRYDPDNQMSLYALASQVAFHAPVKGVIIDAAQIAVGFSRFVRSMIYKTPDQLEEWVKDAQNWIERATVDAEEGYWPQNDKSCSMYGGCPFRGVCSKSPDVRSRFLEAQFEKREWNPLIPR